MYAIIENAIEGELLYGDEFTEIGDYGVVQYYSDSGDVKYCEGIITDLNDENWEYA